MKILFIGNSFTYFNDMPEAIFKDIARQNGRDIEVASVTKGGYTLSKFADKTDEYGAMVESILSSERFDAVVLQEQSRTPISDPDAFKTAVRALYERIRITGARVYLYATWGYEASHPKLSLYGTTTYDMEMKLRSAYQEIAGELGVTVLNVGMAMSFAYKAGVKTLYKEDKYHPALCGSVLAATVIYSTVFECDPKELSLSFVGVDSGDMASLVDAAAYVLE